MPPRVGSGRTLKLIVPKIQLITQAGRPQIGWESWRIKRKKPGTGNRAHAQTQTWAEPAQRPRRNKPDHRTAQGLCGSRQRMPPTNLRQWSIGQWNTGGPASQTGAVRSLRGTGRGISLSGSQRGGADWIKLPLRLCGKPTAAICFAKLPVRLTTILSQPLSRTVSCRDLLSSAVKKLRRNDRKMPRYSKRKNSVGRSIPRPLDSGTPVRYGTDTPSHGLFKTKNGPRETPRGKLFLTAGAGSKRPVLE